MAELFNTEFYATNADAVKPEFPDLDEELEIGMFLCGKKFWKIETGWKKNRGS